MVEGVPRGGRAGSMMEDRITERTERLEDRERALRAGRLVEMGLRDARPPCSRHDDAADDADHRVRLALFRALGLMGTRGTAVAMAAAIRRPRNHKGLLLVVQSKPLPWRCWQARWGGRGRRAVRRH